jgi:predicted membrane protein DUF2157
MAGADMEDRRQALQQIADIARQHGLTAAEIAGAISDSGGPAARRGQAVLVRVLGFLGGTFVFAGIGVFIAMQWDDLNSVSRVVVTLGSGIAALVLAIVAVRDRRFEKAAAPLFLVAAALEPTGMAVAFEEFGSGGDWRWASLIVSGVMAVQCSVTFHVLRRGTLLFLTMLFGAMFSGTALDLMGADETLIALVVGASLLLAAVGADRSGRREITPFWYFVGSALFFHGLFDTVKRTPLEIVFLLIAAGFVYGSVILHSRTLLAVATVALLVYTGWFTSEHFVDSIGWPLALIAFGLVLVGLSAAAFRIDREYVRPRA